MSTLKVDAIRHNSATSDAITTAADGTCTAKLTSINGGQLSHRNIIINGEMQISQRGQTFTDPTGASTYTLDRFVMQNISGTPAFTVTQDTDTPSGFSKSLKVACTTTDTSPASGSYSRVTYRIEAQDLQVLDKGTSSAKPCTLSFYVKTNKTGLYTVFVFAEDTPRLFSASYTVSNTDWNRYTITIPADTSGIINNDNGQGLAIFWGLSIGSSRQSGSLQSSWNEWSMGNEHVGQVNFADSTSNVWSLTGVQLEVGDTATSFEHRSFTDEILRCQRYYTTYKTTAHHGRGGSSSSASFDFQTPVPLRATPSVTNLNVGVMRRYDNTNYGVGSATGSAHDLQGNSVRISFNNLSNVTDNYSCWLVLNNMGLDAEL